jgi:hypothetical protein
MALVGYSAIGGRAMIPNLSSKEEFTKFMLGQEKKRGEPFTEDQKRLSWKVWQQCWCRVRVQLRREVKAIQKQDIKRKALSKNEE